MQPAPEPPAELRARLVVLLGREHGERLIEVMPIFDALLTRLAAAEAVCRAADEWAEENDSCPCDGHKALRRWRALRERSS